VPVRPYRLVRPAPRGLSAPVLDDAQRRVVEHRSGPLLVLAGPGTGKTTTLVESVVARIAEGEDPERILVLTFGRKAAAELRARIAARLGRTTTEPTARTFHSYAFGLLRRTAAEDGLPPPRLLSGPEQDLLIRELLAGDAAGDGVAWPARLRPALRTRGFPAELRDLLLRAAERGVGPQTLARWGREHGRDDWGAAARFLRQYTSVLALRDASTMGSPAYDTAELIRAAAGLLAEEPELLRAERERARWVYVDEYQDTDPAQEALLRLLCGGGRHLVAVGDPDQSIYAFRGTDVQGIREFPGRFRAADGSDAPTVALVTGRRSGPQLLAASRRVARRLRGPEAASGHRDLVPLPGLPSGQAEVHLLGSPSQEAAYIAHRLRAAHLRDGVPWSQMAVLVRSTARHLAVLRRALLSADVPVGVHGEDLPLVQQPGVAPLLLLLRCALVDDALDEDAALTLLQSPLGGADALAVRRIRQELRALASAAGDFRASGRLLVEALQRPAELAAVEERWARPAVRVAGLVAVAREAAARAGASAEDVLWAVWQASGLAARWEQASAEGGQRGAAADRDLDAVVTLFDTAARYVDRMPGSTAAGFLEHVLGQQIAADTLAPAGAEGETVRILTAHSAKGLEWSFVVVAGVQEGLWPDLRLRGSLLGSEDLVDLAAGRDPEVLARVTQVLDEERRLFYVAVTRAKHSLLVTAVTDPDGAGGDSPSRFLDELDPVPAAAGGGVARSLTVAPRTLSLGGLVSELRAVVSDGSVPPPRRRAAAAQLASLAAVDVPGADPASWWGLLPLSDDRPLREPDEPVHVSPSKVEQFGRCELRWLLEAAGGTDGDRVQAALGTLVHEAAVLAKDAGVTEEDLAAYVDRRWRTLDLGGPWFAARERVRVQEMLRRFMAWMAHNPRRLAAVEQEFTVGVGRAVVTGRVDRLEVDDDGRLVVVDLKTGKSILKDGEVAGHAQLAAYQSAVQHGGFDQGTTPGGAALVQLSKSVSKTEHAALEQRQPPLAEVDDPGWADELVRSTAERMAGAAFTATTNQYCLLCPVRSSCPAHPGGGQVTS